MDRGMGGGSGGDELTDGVGMERGGMGGQMWREWVTAGSQSVEIPWLHSHVTGEGRLLGLMTSLRLESDTT